MKTTPPLIVTINRQFGSGGAYIGQQLAKKLNMLYLDREILFKAAEELSLSEDELEIIDEKLPPFIDTVLRLCRFALRDTYIPPQVYFPTDRELFETESQIIKNISLTQSAVIIGRCSSYVLRENSSHVSIFLHASMEFRRARVQKIYGVSSAEAEKMINRIDNERQQYCQKFTREEWTDSRKYHLTFDTSNVNIDSCVEFFLKYLEAIEKDR